MDVAESTVFKPSVNFVVGFSDVSGKRKENKNCYIAPHKNHGRLSHDFKVTLTDNNGRL
jgi:hypothetical protein